MDCFGCRQQFNDKERCPRLLIQCGHTLCESCLSQKLQNKIVTCLECGTMNFAESINLMPKNIALLNVKRQNNVTVTVLKNSPASRRIQNEEESNKDENNCTKHQKKYEEENHKNHELESIINARNGEMKTVEKHLAKAEHLKQKIINSINSIQESTSQLSKITDKSLHEITHFYNNIRKIVNEREEKQKTRVKEQMDREEANLNIQQKSFQSVLQKIEEQSTQYKDLSNLSPILFLKQSIKRKQSMQEATIDESALNASHSTSTKFTFNKEREVQSLIKIINSYLKHEQNKAQQKNENSGQQNANQKALKLNTNVLTQTSSQQAAMAGFASSHSNNGVNNAKENTAKQSKQQGLVANKKDQKMSKSQTNKDSNPQISVKFLEVFKNYKKYQNQKQQNKKLNSQQTADVSSQSSKAKKSFNILDDLRSEELLDDKSQNAQQKQSILNKPLNSFQEMRNQFKEKITSEREQTKSSSSRDEQNYQSQGINPKKEQSKQVNEKNKRSPVSMISLLNPPNPNPTPTVASSLNYHPKAAAGVQLSLQSSSSRANNNAASNTTASSSLSNSKNISGKLHLQKKQDVSKKQDQKQILLNLDFAQQMQNNNQQDQLGKRVNTQQNQNQNDSIEMSEIGLNISEKNEDHQEHVVNNSFKGEINTFLQESSQLKSNITPNLTMIPHQQSSMDTPLSAFNSSQSYGLSKFNNYMSDQNDIYSNKFDFSSLQNSNQFIYVLGGFTENQQYTIDRYDLARNTWEQFDIMPTNRSKFCSALLMNGNILMIGGKQDNQRTASIDEYNPRFKTFLKASLQLTSPRSGFGLVYKNDMIYIVGGNDGYGILDTMEVYDFVLKQVRPYPKMLEKRDELAVTQGLDGKIYAIGGFGGECNTCLNSAERFNPLYQRWEKIAPLNVPRRALSAVTLPDGIYAIGGFDGNNYINSVEKYDEQLDRWTYVSSMRFSRCTSSAIVSQNNQHIYVFGGFDNGPLDSVERFNVINGMWESLQNMPNKRFMHSCQLIQK